MAGPLPERLDVAGVNVELLRRGKGRPLLFLHGGEGVDPRAPFVEGLSREFDLVAASHPGFGLSDLPDHYSHIDDLAYFYLDLIARLGLDEVVLVGASFGGWLAAEIAVKADSSLAGLVLVDAFGIKTGGREERDIVDIFSHKRAEVERLSFADAAVGFGAPTTPDEFLIAARNRDALSLYGWLPYMHNPKLRGRLHRIGVPTLVLWGARDRIALPDYGSRYAAAIPGATFAVMEDAGHLPHVERPEAFSNRIADFAAAFARQAA